MSMIGSPYGDDRDPFYPEADEDDLLPLLTGPRTDPREILNARYVPGSPGRGAGAVTAAQRRPASRWAQIALAPQTVVRDGGNRRLPGMGHGAGTTNRPMGSQAAMRQQRLREDMESLAGKWYYNSLRTYRDMLASGGNYEDEFSAEYMSLLERVVEQGDNFSIGVQNIPEGARADAIYQRDPARSLDGVAVKDLEATVRNMNEDQLTRLQLRMDKVGFYGEGRPVLGRWTMRDREALQQMFHSALDRGASSFSEMLDEMELEAESSMAGQFSDEVLGIDDFDESDVNFATVTSEATLQEMVTEVGQRLIGMTVDPRVAAEIVAELRAKEKGRVIEQERTRRRIARVGGDIGELDAFMEAISGQESGGDYNAVNATSGASGRYQIMPTNWSSWAKMAGLPSNAPRTPENQDRVARVVMASYFQKYKNWRDVAIAWYAGEGVLSNPQTLAAGLDRAQRSGPTIRQYADKVMERYNTALGRQRGELESLVDPETGTVFEENFDAMSEVERAIRAKNAAEVQEFSFVKNMTEFFGMLGGLPGVQ